jgi:cysteinyl-tRNA synthetase
MLASHLLCLSAAAFVSTSLGTARQSATRWTSPQCRVVQYTREGGDTAAIDIAKVEELLFQRSQSRQDRNFAESDRIYNELSQMGVTVFDREMKWFVGRGGRGRGGAGRGGAGQGRGGTFQSGFQRRAATRQVYTRESGDVYPVDVAAVEQLIEQRVALRLSRDFEGADRLRDRLKEEFGVYVVDPELKWYVGSGARARDRDLYADGERSERRSAQSESARGLPADPDFARSARRTQGKRERQSVTRSSKAEPYRRAPSDRATLSASTVAEIEEMVDRRLRAKLAKDFGSADALLGELRSMHGVAISDDQRLWRADGEQFELHEYHEEGSPTNPTPPWIAEAIARRGEARKARDFELADEILASLESEGIGLDDAQRTYRYLPPPPGGYKRPPMRDRLAGGE